MTRPETVEAQFREQPPPSPFYLACFNAVDQQFLGARDVWLARQNTKALNEEADRRLRELLSFDGGCWDWSQLKLMSDGWINRYYDEDHNRVLFVTRGSAAGIRWIAFVCGSRTGLEIFVFERDGYSAYDCLAETRHYWQKESPTIEEVTGRCEGDQISTWIRCDDVVNRVDWTIRRLEKLPEIIHYPRPRLVQIQVTPKTGWMAAWGNRDWRPQLPGVRLVEGEKPSVEFPVDRSVEGVEFAGARQLLAASADSLHRFDLADRKSMVRRWRTDDDPRTWTDRQFTFSRDGSKLFVADVWNSSFLLDVDSDVIRPFPTTNKAEFVDDDVFAFREGASFLRVDWKSGNREVIGSAESYSDFTVGGGRIAAEKPFGVVRLFDIASQTWIVEFEPLQGLHQISLSPCGRWLAMKGQSGLRLIDLATRKVIWEHGDHELHTSRSTVKWTADGKFGGAAGNQFLYVWCMEEPRWVARIPHGRKGYRPDIAIGPDAQSLAASATDSKTVAYWPKFEVRLTDEQPPTD